MRCPNCQAELPDKAQFCPHCGTPIPESSTTQVHQQVGTVTDGGTVIGAIHAGEGSQIQVGGKFVYEAPPVGVAALHQLPPPPRDFTGREAELA